MVKGNVTRERTVRGAAVRALGTMGEREALLALLAALDGEKDWSVRAFLIAALGHVASRDPVPRIPLLLANHPYRSLTPVQRELMGIL